MKKTGRITDNDPGKTVYPQPSLQALDVVVVADNHSSTPNPPISSVVTSGPNLLAIPSPLPPANLSGRDDYIAQAISSVSGTVNVVGRDQINNVTNYFHMNPNLGAEETKLLLNPLFNKLSHVAEASFDASTPALRRACTEMTRTSILEAITKWSMDVTQPMIYWMNGMAGTGKTTIAYSISIILKSLGFIGATFFCSRLVDECTKVERILPTIAYNLAGNYPPLASTILEVLKNDPDIAKRTIYQQFTDLVVDPIRAAAINLSEQPIVIIIDALDECVNQAGVQTLLSVIFRLSTELPFKIFITSRPEQLVRKGFNRQNPDKYSKIILHDIERDIVDADIKLYLTERLVEMADGRSDFQGDEDDWPPKEKVEILTRRSGGLFIFAKTICDCIEEQGGNISEHLDSAAPSMDESDELSHDTLDTSELDQLYMDILDRAIPRRANEQDRLKQILAAIVSIRNPLSACSLGMLLEINPVAIKSSLASLHSVISVPKSLSDPLSTFHASFPDCLTEPTRSRQHFLPPYKSHQMLAKSCLSLMNSSLKENICNLQGRPENDAIGNETISAHIPEGLSYACVYWAFHLVTASKEEVRTADDLRQLLNEFLRDHVLHWMECLSLLGRLNIAIESLRTIEGWLSDVYSETLYMITDARRFAIENYELICNHCLETYYSALVWLPVRSMLRKHHATQISRLPKVAVGLRNSWGCCEKTIICGSEVYSVAFSGDGSQIASGSQDCIVRVWNAVTGESDGIFEGIVHVVRSVAFSNDGSRVASGTYGGGTIGIWNVVTGKLETAFGGRFGGVFSVVYSNDDSHVLSGSGDGKVRIWNVATGEAERVFEGHSGVVRSVALSNDGSHVASGSADGTVRVWNTVTRVLEGVFDCQSSFVSSVAFSSDGSHIASGSYDYVVRIWNTVTGELERVLEGHSHFVLSVAFSNDGHHVLSGSSDSTIRIWNARTGESERVFGGHSGAVRSVTFSSDGSHIVSGSIDGTIRIWNVISGEPDDFDGQSSYVLSVAFSSDGSHVVSGSADGTVQTWNAVTGDLGVVFEGHSSRVKSVAFSNDGSRIASGSDDKTVRVWNASTGASDGVFRGHTHYVLSVAFSSDGSHVVSGSRDLTVRVWNTVTGELEYVLDRVSESVLLSNQTEIQYQSGGEFVIFSTAARDGRASYPRSTSCSLSYDKTWIHTDGAQRSCWIPERYRDFTCNHSCGLKMAFGLRSGNVVIVDLG